MTVWPWRTAAARHGLSLTSGLGAQLAGTKTHAVALRGTFGLRDAPGLTEQLAQALSTQSKVVVDAVELEQADISLLQVLAAARNTAESTGRSLRLAAPRGGVLAQLVMRAGLAAADGAARTAKERFWTDTDAKGTPA
jgi:anti-anti-sigma regulatory factor